MYGKQSVARCCGLAGALALLVASLPAELWSQTEPYVARFVREGISNAAWPDVADTRAIRGEYFWLPQILYSRDGTTNLPVAGIRDSMVMPDDMGTPHPSPPILQEGDFGGLFEWGGCCVQGGTFPDHHYEWVRCVAARADAVGVPQVTLDTLVLFLPASAQPGDCVSLPEKYITELSGELAEDLLPDLEVPPPEGIGVAEYAFADVTRDAAVGVADAVQILRHLVALPICGTCDIDLGDVDRDAAVSSMDAVYILRRLVGIGVPSYHRIDKYALENCQLP
jgi:hypothetical protein